MEQKFVPWEYLHTNAIIILQNSKEPKVQKGTCGSLEKRKE